jgi:hypothetical protein
MKPLSLRRLMNQAVLVLVLESTVPPTDVAFRSTCPLLFVPAQAK